VKKYSYIPNVFRSPLAALNNNFQKTRKKYRQLFALKLFSLTVKKKIIIGSSGTQFKGWVTTDRAVLDLLIEDNWASFFRPNSLDAILAEHVWEHLKPGDAILAAGHCFKYLKPGGYLRIAVPDGYHPDSKYIDDVKPGGSGAGAGDHRVLYNYRTLNNVFESVGFEVTLREYFNENGEFQKSEWKAEDGMIRRSLKFDGRNADGRPHYTSIILDARKPINMRSFN
jgi:predicted SAM-dependent methyltransferase